MSQVASRAGLAPPGGPVREQDVHIDWTIGALNKIVSTFDQPVKCGNTSCGKTYTPREGLNLEKMTLCCPHCIGSEKNPSGFSIAWEGAGFTCRRCERRVPITIQYFYKNAGFLFWRYTNDVGGVRCRKCLDGDFWEASIVSGLFGWYGIISLPLNPFLLGINFIRYVRTIGMPERLPEGEVDGPTQTRIAEDLPNVYRDMERNLSHVAACTNAAKRLGVSPIDVRLALQESIRRRVAEKLG
ncbi:MAG: hypothetical protein KDA31_09125 [Phycisphaerales bacterium]|nr:hypothetical protein [Phycisphaerales bacterium]